MFARLLSAGALLASVAVAQTMYKSVDDSGRVTYSDTPPVGKMKSQETIRILGPSNPGAARQVFDQESLLKKRQEEAQKTQMEAAKKQERENVRKEACSRARGNMRALRDNVPIVQINEAGERAVLQGDARDSESRRLQAFVEENCSQTG